MDELQAAKAEWFDLTRVIAQATERRAHVTNIINNFEAQAQTKPEGNAGP